MGSFSNYLGCALDQWVIRKVVINSSRCFPESIGSARPPRVCWEHLIVIRELTNDYMVPIVRIAPPTESVTDTQV